MLMPSAFLPFFLPPDYSYNQLSQAGRPAEAQLGKSGRNNPAPGCWESCHELPGSRLFRNRTQILPVQVERQLYVGRSFSTVKQYTTGSSLPPQEHMKGKQLLVTRRGTSVSGPIPCTSSYSEPAASHHPRRQKINISL
ncbi:conserved hypothetical protein, partial [Trichinella spiralis]|uniref:hypothetical protein n=1 Tax=Trichinella spiralis TaxID=6334 RepID=UPI0001EFEE05